MAFGPVSIGGNTYTLPPATKESLGGVKVGANLSISEDCTLSEDAQQYSLPAATLDTLGGVKLGEGTQDLTAGVSELEEGVIYLVYE